MKRVLLLAVCGGALLAASGCGGGGGGPTVPGALSDAVVFVSTRDGHAQIYSMNSDGTNQTRLSNTPTTSNDSAPQLSRDGSTIVFSSDRDGNSEIYKMNADGTNVVRLTNDSGPNAPADVAPAISPDGTTIAWTTTRGGGSSIYLMNSDGTNQRAVANTGTAGGPRFSPDGMRLVYLKVSSTNVSPTNFQTVDTVVVRTLSTGSEKVVSFHTNTSNPSAGNGGNIGFSFVSPRFSLDGKNVIYSIATRGANPHQIVAADGSQATPTQYGPDGSHPFAFSAQGNRVLFDGNNQIFVANADFSGQRQLTTLGSNSQPATAE